MSRPPAPLAVAAPLVAAVAVYCLLPPGSVRHVAYPLVGLLCMAVALGGLFRPRLRRPTGWVLVLGGFAGWVVGDSVFALEDDVLHLDMYPAPSDGVYLASYLLLAAGLVAMVRRRGARGDLGKR